MSHLPLTAMPSAVPMCSIPLVWILQNFSTVVIPSPPAFRSVHWLKAQRTAASSSVLRLSGSCPVIHASRNTPSSIVPREAALLLPCVPSYWPHSASLGREECLIFIGQMILQLEFKTVGFRHGNEFDESVHRDAPMVDPVVYCAVGKFDFSGTELSVKLDASSEELHHAGHIQCRCFHCRDMRIVRRSDAQQKTYSFFSVPNASAFVS